MPRLKNRIILFEDRNLDMDPVELAHITKLHNDGKNYKELAEDFKRPEIEIILALLHQVDTEKVDVEPLAFIIPKNSQSHESQVEVDE